MHHLILDFCHWKLFNKVAAQSVNPHENKILSSAQYKRRLEDGAWIDEYAYWNR